MARPSLDQIFASQQTQQRPPLDSFFNTPQASPTQDQMGQQAAAMPTGTQVQQISTNPGTGYGMNTMAALNANSMLAPDANKEAIAGNIANQVKANAIPLNQTESLGSKAGEEVLSGATSIAKDAELGDLMTSAQRARMENYAQAYRGGAAGGMLENLRGGLGQHPITQGLDGGVSKDAISARSAFEASTNGLLSQGQQVFAGQMGTGAASTRIMSSVLDLLKGEFGGPGDSPASMMGRTQGSQQTIYLIQKFGGQYMNTLNQMGITPANIDNLPKQAIDKIADGFKSSVQNGMQSYELTPTDRAIIKARTDYINEPLKELQNNGKSGSVDYKDLLSDIK